MDWNDKTEVLEHIEKKGFMGHILVNASKELRDDIDVVLASILIGGKYNLEFASNRLRNNKMVALTALRQGETAYDHVGDDIKTNKDFILECIKLRTGWGGFYSYEEMENIIIKFLGDKL